MLKPSKLNPAHDAAVRRMLAHPPQPKSVAAKPAKKSGPWKAAKSGGPAPTPP
jgi:hypothetical protein